MLVLETFFFGMYWISIFIIIFYDKRGQTFFVIKVMKYRKSWQAGTFAWSFFINWLKTAKLTQFFFSWVLNTDMVFLIVNIIFSLNWAKYVWKRWPRYFSISCWKVEQRQYIYFICASKLSWCTRLSVVYKGFLYSKIVSPLV